MNILAVFRSRAQTMEFCAELKKYGIPVQTVATPKQAKVGCGLSCKFPSGFIQRAKSVLGGGKYPTFAGFYKVQRIGEANEISIY